MTDYWKRRNEEMKHIQSMFQTDAQYNKAIQDIYQRSQREILKEIDAELMRYAGRENLSMDVARQRVSKMDVEAFQSKAKQYVEEKNFTQRANEELRRYNLKMRMNRLQMLQETIRLETIALADAESKLLHSRLDEELYKEVARQAGILGRSVPSGASFTRKAKAIITADFKGAKFSDRIWANQAELQHNLERVIERTLIQGKHPREGARDLRRLVRSDMTGKPGTNGGAQFRAESLAITESSRVQSQSQKFAYEEFDVKEYEFIAEVDDRTCEGCGSLDGQIFKVADMQPGVNAAPIHVRCRCSVSSVSNRKAWDKELNSRGL